MQGDDAWSRPDDNRCHIAQRRRRRPHALNGVECHQGPDHPAAPSTESQAPHHRGAMRASTARLLTMSNPPSLSRSACGHRAGSMNAYLNARWRGVLPGITVQHSTGRPQLSTRRARRRRSAIDDIMYGLPGSISLYLPGRSFSPPPAACSCSFYVSAAPLPDDAGARTTRRGGDMVLASVPGPHASCKGSVRNFLDHIAIMRPFPRGR